MRAVPCGENYFLPSWRRILRGMPSYNFICFPVSNSTAQMLRDLKIYHTEDLIHGMLFDIRVNKEVFLILIFTNKTQLDISFRIILKNPFFLYIIEIFTLS